MKTKPYYPRPWQIPGLLSGEITRVLLPVKDAPDHPKAYPTMEHGRAVWRKAGTGVTGRDGHKWPDDTIYRAKTDSAWASHPPYQPGDVLAGKEAGEILSYAESHNPHTGEDEWAICGWRYSVDGAIKEAPWANYAEPVENWVGDCAAEKKSPILQPAEFIRLHLRVLTVEAVRVAKIGEADALAYGGWKYLKCPVHKNPERSMKNQYTADHGPDAWDGWAWSVQVERVDTGIPASLEKA